MRVGSLFCFFVVFFNASTLFAAQVANCDNKVNGVCPNGCYEIGDGLGCTKCPEGYYGRGYVDNSAGNRVEKYCVPCSIPAPTDDENVNYEVDFILGEKYTGFTTDECPWVITCPEGYFFAGGSSGCVACSSVEPSNCYKGKTNILKGKGKEMPQDAFATMCEGVVYKITLRKNTELETLNADYPGHEITYSDKTVYAKCDTGFASTEDATKWEDYLAEQLRHPSYYPFKKLLGYSTDDSCTDIVINKDGWVEYDNDNNSTNRTLNIFNKDTELYACWENGEIDVTYYQTTTSGPLGEVNKYTTRCKLDDSKSTPPNDSGSDKPNECAFLDIGYLEGKAGEMIATGYVFKSHDCRKGELGNNQWGDLSFCLDGVKEFAAGKYIPFVRNVTSISVAVVGDECPAGYYCSKTEQNSCPVGTTSAEAKSSIEDCYMPSGQSGTKFCDKNGCFYLPTGIGNISYNPS
ncbi:MAG TPA: hypothetical protein IAC63_03690 [Candidatus Enterousia avicola]|uniref:Tyrosine-protein kinase ephrin type A/B receptor-like domain-containing protein n=1 Tax=Candidatus Enterousia avicola TaxID=2840787 RepID=A0A9D1MS85_9PROT|nr:hypothetical protein [Candidatus Enterousia avicola]